MRLRLSELRRVIGEVAASPAYMAKEEVRREVQQVVVDRVRRGDVRDEADLEDLFATLDMALDALRMVPFDAWSVAAKKAG